MLLTNYLLSNNIYIYLYIYKQDLALNNWQRLNAIKSNNQTKADHFNIFVLIISVILFGIPYILMSLMWETLTRVLRQSFSKTLNFLLLPYSNSKFLRQILLFRLLVHNITKTWLPLKDLFISLFFS